MDFTIGVDIGGSATKFAVVDQAGTVVWPPGRPAERAAVARVSYTVAVPGAVRLVWHPTGEEAVVRYDVVAGDSATSGLVDGKRVVPAAVAHTALKQVLRRVAAGFSKPVAAAGIGATGLIGHDGLVREGYAFSSYRGTDWAAVAREAGFRGPVRVLNDARAAAWAEYVRIGHGGTFLHITAGTRVGCATVQDARLLEGADACAGEFSYQQFIGPDTDRYHAGARLMDGLLDDPAAFGAALTGVIHMINPDRIVLRGFPPRFVAAVQAHVDRYVFKTHWRTLMGEVPEGQGAMLCVTRSGDELVSAMMSDGHTPNEGVAPDFLSHMIVCAPSSLERPGGVCFGEIGGSFGIEADYCLRTGHPVPFDHIAALATGGDTEAAACLERAAKITAAGMVNACRMTGARLVTLGGAVPLLYDPYAKMVSQYVISQFSNDRTAPTIQPSATGNDAGVIGAAMYARRATQTNG